MSVASQRSPDGHTVRIQVVGRFDFASHNDFRGAYRELPGPATSFVVDLSRTEYLDSSALGMLLLLRDHAGADHSHVVIEGTNPRVSSILRMAHFERLFELR